MNKLLFSEEEIWHRFLGTPPTFQMCSIIVLLILMSSYLLLSHPVLYLSLCLHFLHLPPFSSKKPCQHWTISKTKIVQIKAVNSSKYLENLQNSKHESERLRTFYWTQGINVSSLLPACVDIYGHGLSCTCMYSIFCLYVPVSCSRH